MKTLKEVPCGQTVKVTKLNGEGPVKRRIMDMGITKGVEIYVRKVAPLGHRWPADVWNWHWPPIKPPAAATRRQTRLCPV